MADTTHDVYTGAQQDIASLQTQSTRTLTIAVLAGAAAWLSALAIRVPRDTPGMWLLPVGLALVGLLALWAQMVSIRFSRAVFLALLLLVLMLNLHYASDLQCAYYLVLIVLASSAMAAIRGTLLVTVGATLGMLFVAYLWRLSPFPQTYLRAIILCWLTFALSWLTTRNLYLAVEWANQSQAAAQERLEDLRSRRAELRRLSDMLRTNQERLHYLNVRLEQAKVAAEEAYRTKQHFVANVSHELRTPLNLITGFAEMMAFAPESYGGVRLPRSYRQDILEVYRSSRHLVGLVEDVLALAQLEAGQMLIRRDWTDLNALLREIADTMRPLIAAKGLELHLEAVLLPPIFADAGRIRQILLNLLNNAYRYTATGSITLGATCAAGEAVIYVQDTGVGIAAEDLPLIFQDFHKLGQGTAAQRTDGFGLGLSISRRLAEAHGGRLWVQSTVGVGSTFFLALPVENAPAISVYPTLVQTTPSPHRTRSLPVVMAIADAPDDLLGAYLKDYEVVYTTPDQAAASFESYQPIALIANLPPLRQALAAEPAIGLQVPGIPLITCRLPTHADIARQLCADMLLPKPVARADLLAAIGRLSATAPIHTILVVDDELSMLRMLSRFLSSAEEEGFAVTEAAGGAQAIALLEQALPDLLLLDIGMPQVSGYEVLEWLHAQPGAAQTRVIVMTGLHLGADSARVYDIGLHQGAGFSLPKALQIIAALVEQSLPRAPAEN